MRGLRFDSQLRLETGLPEPALTDGDTLIRVRVAGICSTDLEICKGYMQFAGILGHEFVGEVVSSGNPKLIGKRVVAEINCVCGACDLCKAGLPTHCRDRSVVGIYRHDGAFADFLRVPAANCHIVPDIVDDDAAVFVEPLAAAFQVLEQVPVDASQRITILGDGRLGLLCAQVLRNTGASVTVVGRNSDKLALCARWNLRTQLVQSVQPRKDQDIVVDCTASAEGFELAMQMIRPRGTLVLKSTVATGKSLNLAPLVIDEITVVGSRCGPFAKAIDALARRTIDVGPMIHHRFPLDRAVEAMNVAGTRGVLKVLLDV